jgi:hypothetical protein
MWFYGWLAGWLNVKELLEEFVYGLDWLLAAGTVTRSSGGAYDEFLRVSAG